jgi:6-phosphogluconolactonase
MKYWLRHLFGSGFAGMISMFLGAMNAAFRRMTRVTMPEWRQTLLDHVPIPVDHIHPIRCDQSPQQAALNYEKELQDFFGSQPPIFDLVLLGLGENGHTASLFPHTPVLNEQERWVAEVYLAEQDMYRLTLTAPLINQVIFLVCGLEKASVLQYVL